MFGFGADIQIRVTDLLGKVQRYLARKNFLLANKILITRAQLAEDLDQNPLSQAVELQRLLNKCWQDYLDRCSEARRPLVEDIVQQPEAYLEALTYHVDNLGVVDFEVELNNELQAKFINALRKIMAAIRAGELNLANESDVVGILSEIYAQLQRLQAWEFSLRLLGHLGPLMRNDLEGEDAITNALIVSNQLFLCVKEHYLDLAQSDLLRLVFILEDTPIDEVVGDSALNIIRPYFDGLEGIHIEEKAVQLVLAIHGFVMIQKLTIGNPEKLFSLEA